MPDCCIPHFYMLRCAKHIIKTFWMGHHFCIQQSNIWLFGMLTHHYDPLAKSIGCIWAVVYFGLAALAKNVTVYENCMFELIHQDPYKSRYMVGWWRYSKVHGVDFSENYLPVANDIMLNVLLLIMIILVSQLK